MAYVYQSTNPCFCISSTPVTPETPECPDDCNCLKVCNIAINAADDNAPLPCAKTLTLNVMSDDYDHDFCACGEKSKVWTVEDYDEDVFVSATITRAGVLTAITSGPGALAKGYGKIILKVCCGPLSHYITVLVGIKDPCDGCADCGDCEVPDPCTCECDDAEIDIFLNTVPQSGNTLLQ